MGRDEEKIREIHRIKKRFLSSPTAVLDAQQSESRHVEKTQSGGQEGEHGRQAVRPNAAKFTPRFFLRIDVLRVPVPPVTPKRKLLLTPHLHCQDAGLERPCLCLKGRGVSLQTSEHQGERGGCPLILSPFTQMLLFYFYFHIAAVIRAS